METFSSTIRTIGENHSIELSVGQDKFLIPLTEDKPNEIKEVFNKLILHLKEKEFSFSFDKTENSLYFQIGEEYIKQLNQEMTSIRRELEDYSLVMNVVDEVKM